MNNESLSFAATWMELEDTVLSEISQGPDIVSYMEAKK